MDSVFKKNEEGDVTGAWSNYTRDTYASFAKPILSTDIHSLEDQARAKLPHDNFTYAGGAAGSGETHRSNLAAFKDYRIIPRMLVDANKRDLSVTLFGVKYSSPVLIGPVGVLSLFHEDGEIAVARAAAKINVPMVMSTASTTSIEEVGAANGNSHRWYQLYWPVSDDITLSLLSRAKAAGFTALVVTLDTSLLGFRPQDLDTAHLPFLQGLGCGVGFSDPVFTAKHGFSHVKGETVLEKTKDVKEILMASLKWLGEVNSGNFKTWSDLAFLRENWEGPLIVKGVLTVEDALKAAEMKCDGIIVSNHGGRQIDGSISALSALDKITSDPRTKDSGLTVLFDSGIRTGVDVIKALSLGAAAVMIGRPYVYGLSLKGQEGVEHVVKTILADAELSMGLMGCPTIAHLGRGNLEKVSSS